jgi:hypothetical protein
MSIDDMTFGALDLNAWRALTGQAPIAPTPVAPAAPAIPQDVAGQIPWQQPGGSWLQGPEGEQQWQPNGGQPSYYDEANKQLYMQLAGAPVGGTYGDSGSGLPDYYEPSSQYWVVDDWENGGAKSLQGKSYNTYNNDGSLVKSGIVNWAGNDPLKDALKNFALVAGAGLAAGGLAGAGAGGAGAGSAGGAGAAAAGDAFLPGALGAGGSEVAMGSLIPGLEAYALPAAAVAGPGMAGWGADLGMEGLAGATPSAGMGTTLTGTAGGALTAAGAAGAGGGVFDALKNAIPSGASSWLGPAATALGGLAGSQGQESSQTSARRTDPRVDPYLFGSGANPGLLGYTQQQLASQMSPGGMAGYDQMQTVGRGLLGTPVAGAAGADFSGYGGQSNPWMSATADEIGRRTQDGLGQAFNQIRSNAVGVGGLGGSRQGIAESNAIKGAMDSMQGQLAGMYGADWLASQNRGLTQRSQDMGYDISRRGQDLTQIGLGADLYNRGAQGGWLPLQNASSIFNSAAGNNVTSTSASEQGGGALGALGGMLGTAAIGDKLGWWNGWK